MKIARKASKTRKIRGGNKKDKKKGSRTPKSPRTPKKSPRTPKSSRAPKSPRTPRRKQVRFNEPKKLEKPEHLIVFGHVYSDECGYCQNMKPAWKELVTEMKPLGVPICDIGKNYDTEIANFNQTYNTQLETAGYPTIFRLTRNSPNVDYYRGERTHPSMREWLYSGAQ